MITAKIYVALSLASVIYAAPHSTISVHSISPSSTESATLKPTHSAPQNSTTSVHSIPPSSTASPTPQPTHSTNVTQNFTDMKALFDGNTKFQSTVKATTGNYTAKEPAFMFIGCSDNRISSGAIFNAPVGSIVSQNNIGNQYSEKDLATHAALTYAIEDLKVKHIIVLGHYGCKGVETAITSSQKQTTSMQKWVKPIIDIFVHSRRGEIKIMRNLRKPQRNKKNTVTATPKADNPGFKALVEENVKQSVDRIKKQSILAAAYKKKMFHKNKQQEIEVYVHGLVYNESNGEVKNLRVSFGPPGKTVPDIPFPAIEAAHNWHGPKWLPGINKGKNTKTVTVSAPAQTKG